MHQLSHIKLLRVNLATLGKSIKRMKIAVKILNLDPILAGHLQSRKRPHSIFKNRPDLKLAVKPHPFPTP